MGNKKPADLQPADFIKPLKTNGVFSRLQSLQYQALLHRLLQFQRFRNLPLLRGCGRLHDEPHY
jgi:hypothetical protein